MKKTTGISAALYAIMLLLSDCLDQYSPRVIQTNFNYLVIDGFLNNSSGPTTIKLSRTIQLDAKDTIRPEPHALVQIEVENGNLYTLAESDAGTYTSSNLLTGLNNKARLKIKLTDGKEYVSDYVPVRETPAIDSIKWTDDGTDFRIFANAPDATDNTHYYLWKY